MRCMFGPVVWILPMTCLPGSVQSFRWTKVSVRLVFVLISIATVLLLAAAGFGFCWAVTSKLPLSKLTFVMESMANQRFPTHVTTKAFILIWLIQTLLP